MLAFSKLMLRTTHWLRHMKCPSPWPLLIAAIKPSKHWMLSLISAWFWVLTHPLIPRLSNISSSPFHLSRLIYRPQASNKYPLVVTTWSRLSLGTSPLLHPSQRIQAVETHTLLMLQAQSLLMKVITLSPWTWVHSMQLLLLRSLNQSHSQ